MDIRTTLGGFALGSPMMLLILLVGIAGLAVALERCYAIVVRSQNNGRVFIERVVQLVRGGKIDEAIKQCAGSSAALADIGLLILRSRSRNEADLRHIADAAVLHVVPRLTRRTEYLKTLASVAVLLGVGGALHGLGAAFLAQSHTENRAEFWADTAGALSPAAVGFMVAAILTLFRGYIVSQSESITEQIHEFSARLINALIDRPDVRLGHR